MVKVSTGEVFYEAKYDELYGQKAIAHIKNLDDEIDNL